MKYLFSIMLAVFSLNTLADITFTITSNIERPIRTISECGEQIVPVKKYDREFRVTHFRDIWDHIRGLEVEGEWVTTERYEEVRQTIYCDNFGDRFIISEFKPNFVKGEWEGTPFVLIERPDGSFYNPEQPTRTYSDRDIDSILSGERGHTNTRLVINN